MKAILLFVTLFLTACGGGGGSDSSSPVSPGPNQPNTSNRGTFDTDKGEFAIISSISVGESLSYISQISAEMMVSLSDNSLSDQTINCDSGALRIINNDSESINPLAVNQALTLRLQTCGTEDQLGNEETLFGVVNIQVTSQQESFNSLSFTLMMSGEVETSSVDGTAVFTFSNIEATFNYDNGSLVSVKARTNNGGQLALDILGFTEVYSNINTSKSYEIGSPFYTFTTELVAVSDFLNFEYSCETSQAHVGIVNRLPDTYQQTCTSSNKVTLNSTADIFASSLIISNLDNSNTSQTIISPDDVYEGTLGIFENSFIPSLSTINEQVIFPNPSASCQFVNVTDQDIVNFFSYVQDGINEENGMYRTSIDVNTQEIIINQRLYATGSNIQGYSLSPSNNNLFIVNFERPEFYDPLFPEPTDIMINVFDLQSNEIVSTYNVRPSIQDEPNEYIDVMAIDEATEFIISVTNYEFSNQNIRLYYFNENNLLGQAEVELPFRSSVSQTLLAEQITEETVQFLLYSFSGNEYTARLQRWNLNKETSQFTLKQEQTYISDFSQSNPLNAEVIYIDDNLIIVDGGYVIEKESLSLIRQLTSTKAPIIDKKRGLVHVIKNFTVDTFLLDTFEPITQINPPALPSNDNCIVDTPRDYFLIKGNIIGKGLIR